MKLAAGFPTCCHLLEKKILNGKNVYDTCLLLIHIISLRALLVCQLVNSFLQSSNFSAKKGTPRLILAQNNNQVSANSKYGIVTTFRVSHILTEQQEFYKFQIKLIELRLATKQQVI